LFQLQGTRKIKYHEVIYHQISKCKIENPVADVTYWWDGGVIGNTPIGIEVMCHATNLLKVES